MQLTEEIIRFFNLIGSLICHQRKDRTLWVGGHYLPVCARDTGAFIGLLLGYVVVLFLRRKEAKGPPNLYLTLAMMLPMLVDSFLQALGFWTSTNDLRLITGLLFGSALAPLLVYALSLFTFKRRIPILHNILVENPILDNKDSWLSAKALLLTVVFAGTLFLAVKSVAGSDFYLFYWILSIPIVAVIISHAFILPPLLIALGIDKLLNRQ
jgi:uncharacterized membrane protein